jgi:hypothetical protein
MFQIAEQNRGHLSSTLYYKYGFALMEVDLTIEQCSQMLQVISQNAKHLMLPRWCPSDLLQIGAQKRSFYLIMRGQTTLILPGLAFENSASIQAENQRLNHEISNLESFVLCEDPKIEIQFNC